MTSETGVLPSMTNSWLSSAFSLRNLAIGPSTILATTSAGLPDLGSLLGSDRALALDDVRIQAFVQRQREGGGDVHRQLLAERLEHVDAGFDSSATSTPILPRPGAAALWT
jgi:hypothetical protein